ncbi:MAG: GNAT family N-acetyltransferase [Candidatus Micrarchaeales archaeon]|nr:GNAT family N-acetyltransferase [Candidatus Micrarchaeales archaeon]
MDFVVKRNAKITPIEVEELRLSVGWNPNHGMYEAALKNTYATFSIKSNGKLIAFARVVSDRSIYAIIVDLNVRPEFQNKGVAKKLMRHIIRSMKKDRIEWVQLLFMPDDKKLDHLYRSLGFKIGKSGYLELN